MLLAKIPLAVKVILIAFVPFIETGIYHKVNRILDYYELTKFDNHSFGMVIKQHRFSTFFSVALLLALSVLVVAVGGMLFGDAIIDLMHIKRVGQ